MTPLSAALCFRKFFSEKNSPVPGLPLTPPWKWAWTQAGKERVLYYLQAHARNDAIFSPQNWGKNHIWKEIPNLGRVYSQCFYTENMAGNLKGNDGAKFLETTDFAFKKCQFNFVPRAEQVQAIHAVVTGNMMSLLK